MLTTLNDSFTWMEMMWFNILNNIWFVFTSPHEKRLRRRILLIGSLTCWSLFSAKACKSVWGESERINSQSTKQITIHNVPDRSHYSVSSLQSLCASLRSVLSSLSAAVCTPLKALSHLPNAPFMNRDVPVLPKICYSLWVPKENWKKMKKWHKMEDICKA